MFAAVLDTCVLWPSLQRDFVLSLAIEGLYRPLWSETILGELHRHEQRKWIRRGKDHDDAFSRADHLTGQMRSAFADAIVHGWEPLAGTYGLPDPDDEHVVAAAVVGGAGTMVTDNLKDFPRPMVPAHIQVLHPRQFAADTVDVDPARAAAALHQIAERLHDPPRTPGEILDLLAHRYRMTDVAEIVRPHL